MSRTHVPAFEWIDDDDALAEFCAHARHAAYIAIDTEFHRERTYYAQLALIQIATEERVVCIDPLAEVDLGRVDALVFDENVLKVMHAGRQDLEIFFDRAGRVPAPIFDTQIAAGLLGLGDQLGYGALVERIVGASLPKTHARTDWMKRPLQRSVLDYAANDVIYLRDVFQSLDQELRDRGRRKWLDEEQAHLGRIETFHVDEDEAWRRVKSVGKLRGVECAVAQALAGWRERRARKVDRPRRRVLSDDAIIDLARQRPTRAQALGSLRAVDDGIRKRHGEELAELIAEAAARPETDWPAKAERRRLPRFDDAVVLAMNAVLQLRARDADISAKILAARSDLELIAAGETDVPLLQGWRAEIAGDAVLAFLQGKSRLVARGERLHHEDA